MACSTTVFSTPLLAHGHLANELALPTLSEPKQVFQQEAYPAIMAHVDEHGNTP